MTERDLAAIGDAAATGDAALGRFAQALAAAGLVVSCREATTADVDASSWAKRLGIPHSRPAWLLEAQQP